MSNKYGLILSEKSKTSKPVFQASKNVFGDESDSEDDGNKKPVLLRPSHNSNRQARITQEKAVIEDPTVYQYDEIYDSMTTKKKEEISKTKESKKPKYIENLLKTANKRKIENERRIERQVQKEREKEGDEFADKEVFVTSAYKKKLEEMRQEEEKERREEYLESIGDVTKQTDLGGFYRHLYEQKLGSEKSKETQELQQTNQNIEKEIVTEPSDIKSDSQQKSKTNAKPDKQSRNYRRRKSSDSNPMLSEGEIVETDDEINRVNIDEMRAAAKKSKQEKDENIDADSDFSIDSSSEDERTNEGNSSKENKTVKSKEEVQDSEDVKISSSPKQKESKQPREEVKPKLKPKETKPKIDIWKKRTVGEVFEEALKRYYERKSARGY